MSFLLPVHRLRETDTLLAFRHPRPQHAFHVLLVPKRSVASLSELPASDVAFFADLVRTVQELVQEFELPAYRLIVNGGWYQDFPQLHFHLVSDELGSRSPSSNANLIESGPDIPRTDH